MAPRVVLPLVRFVLAVIGQARCEWTGPVRVAVRVGDDEDPDRVRPHGVRE
ncbi:MAG TPA: hypothetical protein PLL30_10495 [Candidatus Krumholzibacteria bacterium]|nr:hypothetical protein [Candidatus Krumholzibacteria bacterium]HPD72191.1 hypothetical protein [Candidatus Krumholzibacteria bacterium]HRY40877.1 hypothetical protein [Candidatus Krumholzibacteria bacterium]